MKQLSLRSLFQLTAVTFMTLPGCSSTPSVKPNTAVTAPSQMFDLSHWKITLPMDDNGDGKVDEVDTKEIQGFSHPDYFYLDADGGMVFTAPNKATTTANSSNTRSELRQMPRGGNFRIKTKAPKNNFALASHPWARRFASVGGKMEATLKVNHVATRAGHPDKPPAYSVVVGQIHAGKDQALIATRLGFGYGNEPLKIYYKKWPEHNRGSVFWTYERNLPKDDSNRTDIAYPVWGYTWENPSDPGQNGIALDESFSYTVNVHDDVMHLTFSAAGKKTVRYSINLANNIDAYGKLDPLDHKMGYTGDWHYFKAGAYNQCSTKDAPGGWYAACLGTGDWKTDKKNGDYTQVTFSKLKLSKSTAVND